MNFSERNNFIIAVFVSLLIHFYLLTIHFSSIPTPKEPETRTFPVGIVEFSSESKSRQITVALNTPGKEQPNQEKTEMTSVKNLEKQSVTSEKTEIKPAAPGQPLKNASLLSEKEETRVSDAPMIKPENQSIPRGNIKETASGNSDTGETQSFGTGEAMVKIIGPMPTYPRAPLREGIEGEVTVRILINTDGQLDLAIVIKTSGGVRLDYAATSSIERKWKFTSINKGYYIDLTFSFDLHTGASVKFIASKIR